ncbi:hypothetical protein CYMTET_50970 [Cymbomonas tetramitiformis]|uniref:Uncharacterized protein n=1 Tax=Cymbomonas tetramitiformis TaxID=36881 RepID=A0AAE0ESA3_9CHLO|nr:hypothetical protein CYMTET_50970 [Cymbomonas tetramitiformis]
MSGGKRVLNGGVGAKSGGKRVLNGGVGAMSGGKRVLNGGVVAVSSDRASTYSEQIMASSGPCVTGGGQWRPSAEASARRMSRADTVSLHHIYNFPVFSVDDAPSKWERSPPPPRDPEQTEEKPSKMSNRSSLISLFRGNATGKGHDADVEPSNSEEEDPAILSTRVSLFGTAREVEEKDRTDQNKQSAVVGGIGKGEGPQQRRDLMGSSQDHSGGGGAMQTAGHQGDSYNTSGEPPGRLSIMQPWWESNSRWRLWRKKMCGCFGSAEGSPSPPQSTTWRPQVARDEPKRNPLTQTWAKREDLRSTKRTLVFSPEGSFEDDTDDLTMSHPLRTANRLAADSYYSPSPSLTDLNDDTMRELDAADGWRPRAPSSKPDGDFNRLGRAPIRAPLKDPSAPSRKQSRSPTKNARGVRSRVSSASPALQGGDRRLSAISPREPPMRGRAQTTGPVKPSDRAAGNRKTTFAVPVEVLEREVPHAAGPRKRSGNERLEEQGAAKHASLAARGETPLVSSSDSDTRLVSSIQRNPLFSKPEPNVGHPETSPEGSVRTVGNGPDTHPVTAPDKNQAAASASPSNEDPIFSLIAATNTLAKSERG